MLMKYFRIYFLIFCSSLCLSSDLLFAGDIPAKPFDDYNVVLVFIDTLRADHLSCYGYFRETSPNIDKLAEGSFIFKENYSPVSYTLPSFMSIITSLYPVSHGVWSIRKDKLSGRVKTLAQILKIYGYKTAWVGPFNDPQLDPEAGYGRGFDTFEPGGSNPDSSKTRQTLLDWLDNNNGKKFFLNFHTYKPHAPYFPSPAYKQRFTEVKNMKGVMTDLQALDDLCHGSLKEGLRNRELVDGHIGKDIFDQITAAGALNGGYDQVVDFFNYINKPHKLTAYRDYLYWQGIKLEDPEINAYVQAVYDAAILEYDKEVLGPVIDKLKALDLYDKTIIVICSDHGEEFYEHNDHAHGRQLYVESTRVPFIIRVPWMKRGKTINDLVQTVDIMPTILDLLGIPLPAQTQGKSLVDLMDNKGSGTHNKYAFGKSLAGVNYIRSKEWLLISYDKDSRPKELYQIASDPKERLNVYSRHKETAFRLGSELKKWETSLPSYQDEEYSFAPEIDQTTQERIRKTGYW